MGLDGKDKGLKGIRWRIFMETKCFFDLWDWNEAESLADEIYLITFKFPIEEKYGLISQLRSAAVSVFSNIAEGSGRGSFKDYVRFLINARGSIQEVLAQLHFSKKRKYISNEEYEKLFCRYNRLAAAINNHIKSLRSEKD